MRKYKITVRGQNFLLPCDGEPQKLGFSQTFYLRAVTPEKAEEEVTSRLARDPYLVQNALNGPGDPFRVVVESVRWAGPLSLFTEGKGRRSFSLEKEEDKMDGEAAGGHC
ncbi:MAG TPA: hypothetical protein VJ882_03255 [Desulfuromonadales bacterium]|nr:hypothetical protein [Desulfuromonadales bacterium]